MWAWGWNGLGELGTGSTTDSRLPVKVTGLGGVVEVSAGLFHSLAVKADGTAWAWGWNGFGQLGDGTVVDRHAPVLVAAGGGSVRHVGAGIYASLLSRDDGRVLATGWNGLGGLGDGSTIDRHAFVLVPGLTGVREISAGGLHGVAA